MAKHGSLPANFNKYHRQDIADNARLWMEENCLRIADIEGKNPIKIQQKIEALLRTSSYGERLRRDLSSIVGYDEESFSTTVMIHYREIMRLQGTIQPEKWFKHEQLPSGDWLRTVKVLPKRDLTIRCEIRAVERHRAEYRCLSYEWVRDYRADTHGIELNGVAFRVRDNLYDFLDVAQSDYPNEEFWIDAMCIDQTNMQERNDQVSKMGETYSGKRVLAWLGKRKPEDQALEDKVIEELQVFQKRSETDYHWIVEAYRTIREFWAWPSYWLRAWIVQEQQLAGDVLLLLDKEQHTVLELEQIRAQAHDMLESYNPRSTGDHNLFYFARSQFDQLEITAFLKRAHNTDRTSTTDMSRIDGDPPFAHVLKSHRHVYCENWHDKIYALRALCSEGKRIRVDYEEDLRSLLIQVLSAPLQPFCLCFVRNLVKIYSLAPDAPELSDMLLQSTFTFARGEKTAVTSLMIGHRSSQSDNHVVRLDQICSNLTGEMILVNDQGGYLIARMPWSDTALQVHVDSRPEITSDIVLTISIPVSTLCLQYLTVFAARYDEVACDIRNTTFLAMSES